MNVTKASSISRCVAKQRSGQEVRLVRDPKVVQVLRGGARGPAHAARHGVGPGPERGRRRGPVDLDRSAVVEPRLGGGRVLQLLARANYERGVPEPHRDAGRLGFSPPKTMHCVWHAAQQQCV